MGFDLICCLNSMQPAWAVLPWQHAVSTTHMQYKTNTNTKQKVTIQNKKSQYKKQVQAKICNLLTNIHGGNAGSVSFWW